MTETEEVFSLEAADHIPPSRNLVSEVIMGLSKSQKTLPAKFLYDKTGSEIFEEICLLPSYYPTRTETKILRDNAREMADMIGEDVMIIEPGSGSAEKVRILLKELHGKRSYVPLEISREILLRTSRELIDEFPGMDLYPVCADFTKSLSLPLTVESRPGKKIVFFPGSTIGNLDPDEARDFLKEAAALSKGGGILIGVDLKKDPEILRLAYNDPEGVTAAFNLNLLYRLNREANATFVPENFRHEAIYNEEKGRIEMHLISRMPQLVRVNQTVFRFHEGESIHTENSYKYSVKEFTELGEQAGLVLKKSWQDKDQLFSVYYFEHA
ncbi:MAG: L-histidine N(alpha)-methyltransferase [Bdellovibrionota bacterium]